MFLQRGFLQSLGKALLTLMASAGLLCALSTLSVASDKLPVPAEVLGESYVLGVDDVLKINIYGEEDLTGSYRVAKDGTISMPLIGDIMLGGHSIRHAQEHITALLMEGYLVDPSVSIEVTEYRPFYIMGEIRTPGSYSYVSHMSILGAVAQAGGFTYRAHQDDVKVLRAENGKQPIYHALDIKSHVMPGDIIVVRERFL